ncbi:MAG: sulfatase-like hydrolase/transferase, partial [Kiritimatiellia bacterium]|nr:sulfatase-like hydrolase/transferase [Kiritimatiellia bacterium]
MNRRSFMRTIGLGATGAIAGSVFAVSDKKPNVLFIVVDDLRTSVGMFGDKLAVTPNIDALGSRGTVFPNAHCQIAICNPSRAS